MKPISTKSKIIFTVAIIVAVSTILYILFGQQDKKLNEIVKEKKLNKITVETSKISKQLFSNSFSVPATLEPFETVNVSFESSGIIKKFAFNLGNKIQKGQLIAVLDNEIEKPSTSIKRYQS